MRHKFTLFIVIGMILGGIVGGICHQFAASPVQAHAIADYFSMVTDVFLRLIKMIIAPLVFSTLVAGIAHMDSAAVGRIGAKTLVWFFMASLVSLLIGMTMATVMHPGTGLHLTASAATATLGVPSTLSLRDFLNHVFPASIISAMAANEILQIVVFSLFAGVALAALGKRTAGLLALIEQLSSVMLKITDYVMKCAPVAVFAALAGTATTQGLGVLRTYATFVSSFYISLMILWGALFAAGFFILGPQIVRLMRAIRQPALLAFSTASSEAAYPRTLEALEGFGVPKKLASFVLPLGYSFNLDGSMMYSTFAILFIAQVYDVQLTLSQHVLMVAILMLTSKGIAGVPRASLVVIAAALPFFHIPEGGLLLIIGVDQFLDMGRSATNVIGNSIASAVIAKWESEPLQSVQSEFAGDYAI